MRSIRRHLLSLGVLITLTLAGSVSAELALHLDMEQTNSPLVDRVNGLAAEAVDDGHLYSVEGPVGFGMAVGLESNGSWQLDVDESATFREFANDFSVAAWIYLDSDTLAAKSDLAEPNYRLNRFFGDDVAWDADGWGMGIWEDGRIRFTKNGVLDMDTANPWVELDTWVHVAATVSANDGVTIYVNGEEAQLFPDTRDLNNGPGNNGEDDVYGIGRTYGFGEGQWVGGRFDEIRVYDHVLSAEEVAGLMIPSTGTPGDYNQNGQLDAGDLDLQAGAINVDGPLVPYDENKDSHVTYDDRRIWVNNLKKTYIGDADLSGEFTSSDLIAVFVAGKYETGQAASWSAGDFDGDQKFGSSDLVQAFVEGGYELGPRPAVSPVPEPSSVLLVLLGLFGLTGWSRAPRALSRESQPVTRIGSP